jgi:hypothetical protein
MTWGGIYRKRCCGSGFSFLMSICRSGHADFITITGPRGPYDWTIPNTGDVDGALRGEFLAKTDGSGILQRMLLPSERPTLWNCK